MFTPSALGKESCIFPDRFRGRSPVILYSAFASFSIGYAVATSLPPHRIWALFAGVVYVLAAVASHKNVAEGRVLSFVAAGAVAVPLFVQVVGDVSQPEVSVVVRAAQRFISEGTPYLIDPKVVDDYNPYSPLMVMFGLPSALSGDWLLADPRLWFVGVFGICLLAARSLLPDRPAAGYRPLAFVLVSPLVAVTVVTSGIDLPLIGLLVLVLAAAWSRRSIAAGLLLGVTVALKWTAVPVIGVVLIVLWRRDSPRASATSAVATVGAALVGVVVGAHANLGSFVEHTLMFPLGRGTVATPAGDSLLGGLLRHVPGGEWMTCLLLAATVGALAVVLMRRRLDVFTVASCTAAGFIALFLLAPSARAGYFVLPAVLIAAAYAYRGAPQRHGSTVGSAPVNADALPGGPGDREEVSR